MQKTVLPVQHPVKALQGYARQIALPGEHAPERFPSFPSLDRTALMAFNSPSTLNVPASTTVRALVFRQAAYPLWTQQSVLTGYAVIYASDFCSEQASNLNTRVANFNIARWTAGNVAASGNNVGFSGATSTPTYAIMGYDSLTGSAPWTYVPEGCILTVVAGTNSARSQTTTVLVTLQVWTSPGECTQASNFANISIAATNLSGAAQVALPSGWYRPISADVSCTTAQTGGLNGFWVVNMAVSFRHCLRSPLPTFPWAL